MQNTERPTSPAIIPERLARLETLSLKSGSHKRNAALNACAMEAASWIAGEEWSDSPGCTSPVIAAFMRSWNDSLPTDADRDRLLKPLIPVIVGTRSTAAAEQRRATMAADWFIRVHAPAWLRLAGLNAQADSLERLPEITDFAQCPALMPTLEAVRKDSTAAGDAAGAAAWDAARAAAGAAAWAAAWAAARAAAGAKLAPTVAQLQTGAQDLVRRMSQMS